LILINIYKHYLEKQFDQSKHTLINPNKNKAEQNLNSMNHIYIASRFELLTSLTNDYSMNYHSSQIILFCLEWRVLWRIHTCNLYKDLFRLY